MFFDTNILVYSVTALDPRRPVARAVLETGGTISSQVLNEFANVASGKLRWTWPEVRSAVAQFVLLCPHVRPLTLATHVSATEIAERDGVAWYDALIIAAALEAGCTTLLSEDMQHGRVIAGRLAIRNPFLG